MNGTTPEQDVAGTIAAFFRRIFLCNFRTERAVAWEGRALERRGVVHPLAQAYASWRWPLLAFAVPFLLFHGIWDLASFEWSTSGIKKSGEQGQEILRVIGTGSFDLFDAFRLLGIISILVGAVMFAVAVGFWSRVRVSRMIARIGWLFMFATPFLLAVFPHASLMDLDRFQAWVREQAGAGASEEAVKNAVDSVRKMMGMLFAVATAMAIGPRIFGLFPGMIRSSVSLKTLLPESSAVGWLTVIAAPFWVMFLLLGLSVINQMQPSVKLVLGFLLWMLATLVYLVRAKAMIRPCPAEHLGKAIVWPRRIATVLALVGSILLVWTFFEEGEVGHVISFICGTVGNMLVLTVVASDFMLPLLRWSFRQGQQFQLSPLMPVLVEKIQAFVPVTPVAQPVLELSLAEAPPVAATAAAEKVDPK